jgi:hypothetical protein
MGETIAMAEILYVPVDDQGEPPIGITEPVLGAEIA